MDKINQIKEYSLTDAAGTIFSTIQQNDLSEIFFWAIIIYFFIALTSINSRNRGLRPLADHAPTTLTTLGILGTFTGIFLGLIDFNFETPGTSIPALLTGLKIAFGTSIVGIFAAIIFKLSRPFISADNSLEEVDYVSNKIVEIINL